MAKHYSFLRKSEIFADEVISRARELFSEDKKQLKKRSKDLKSHLTSVSDVSEYRVEAFAIAMAMIKKVYNIELYKVQIMGGYTLDAGDVAEMKTGEGKTLTAIAPAYFNSIIGNKTYVITVNDYLASRDAAQVSKVHNELGLSVGVVSSGLKPEEKKDQYDSDIIYLTNSELGFDYLRDNMAREKATQVQARMDFAIVDEIDSVLIDEARTPLIISGGAREITEDYKLADQFVSLLDDQDYTIDKERRMTFLTEEGIWKAENHFELENLYSFKNSQLVHRIQNALQAYTIFKKDVDYTVKEGEIVLIDIFTGRLLPGRSFSEGLNQAIEAKEGVELKPENKTLASVTYQNLFRMFTKLSGMSGTAATEEEEFFETYNMRVIQIPTHRPIQRIDHADLIHRTKDAKFFSVMSRIVELHERKQPILVGTRSVSDSEMLSTKLSEINLDHEVLNANNHAREAEIIEKAGQKGSITISTNMAGRGTDIKLGEGVEELGGLFVIGTERAEARRIDDQLIGRSGRQGNIGHSQFFVSLEDEILLRAGMKKVEKLFASLDDNPIESKSIQKTINTSQKRIEGGSFDQRKTTLEYDDVLNRQRIIVYAQRQNILSSRDIKEEVFATLWRFLKDNLDNVEAYKDGSFSAGAYVAWINETIGEEILTKEDFLTKEELFQYSIKNVINYYEKLFDNLENSKVKNFLMQSTLSSIDFTWQNQLDGMNKLRLGIKYQQYAQKNPLQLYVLEANKMFEAYKREVRDAVINSLINIKRFISPNEETKEIKERKVKDLIL